MKKIIYIALILFCLVSIYGLSRSIYETWQKKEVLIEAQKELERAKKEQISLKKSLSQVQKPEFREEQIRNKLFLIKPEEKIIILPDIKEENIKKVEVKKEDPILIRWYKKII